MPIYEYECGNCGKIEEALQKFSDKPLTTCRYCNGKLHRLISQSAFHLKGSGWYVTDYANKSKTNSATDSKPSKSGTTTTTSTTGSSSTEKSNT